MKKYLHFNRVVFAVFLMLIFNTAFSQNWQLIHPVYPTTDDIVAGYSVADFGATGDGVTDVTAIFQNQLNALGAAGGGTLWVPAGKYVISGNLLIPKGVTLRGDWQQPVPGQPITGTILMAYAGRGDTTATAFITEQTACAVMDIAIWYPQQLPGSVAPYPAAILMGAPGFWGNDFNNAKNITLVNAYDGIAISELNGGGCPIINGIYGTPLSTGIMIDNISDVGRLENINFSPAYWEGSGLPNAPAVGSSVESWILQNGTGIVLRRDDWTYTSFVSVTGYNIGFRTAPSVQPGSDSIANGHNYGMTFTNCNTGLYFGVVNNVGIMFANVNTVNCKNGIYVGAGASGTAGAIQLHTCSINGATNPVYTDPSSTPRLMMQHCTITGGKIDIGGGTFMASDCDFNNASPQVTLERNSRSILTTNRFQSTRNIQNNSFWVSAIDTTSTFTLKAIPNFPTIVPQTHQAAKQVMYLATAAPYNAVNDGTTDNTNAIQSALNAASAGGGGIVFLPPGHYLVAGNLMIPTGVELKGASDLSAAPYGPGSVLEVTANQGNPSGTPFLQVSANSGVRGIVFDYPNQMGSLVPNFLAYPYTIQVTGSNAYIINIAFRAVYNGIDLFTNKCDNHYLDYVCGQVFQNVFTVGGGSTGGVISNAHFNTIYYANGTESKFGSWPNSPSNDGDPNVYNYNYDNCKFLNLGNCQNETLYNDFIYGSEQGINLNSDNGSAPTGQSLGLGIDGTRNSMNFNAIGAAGFDFVNTQIVALTDVGNSYIATSPTFASQNTTLFNSDYWGNPPTGIILNGGTVNLQAANFNQPAQTDWGNLTSGSLNVFGSAIWPVTAAVNAGAEPLLTARSSIIDSTNINKNNAAVWVDNLENAWSVNPLKAMSRWGWTASASVDNGQAQDALDSNETTRWATSGPQSPGQYFIANMQNLKQFYEIALENANSSGDYPVGYAVYVSTDGVNWGSPVATGVGTPGLTIITFPTQIAQYIKVVQTGSTSFGWWSLYEFYVFGVNYVATTGVTVSPATATIGVGSTQQLIATLTPANASDTTVTWTTSDPTKATVDSTGLVTGIAIGSVTITATTQDGNKTATSTITVAGSETPYGGTPWPIPGTIQAENYDLGGQGVAYNDSDPTNDGGQYRPTEGVDIEADADGGYDVGWTVTGEWMNYTVYVTTAGVYTLQSRVATNAAGSSFHVSIDGTNISGSIIVPNTGGFQYWQTLDTTTTYLSAGQHIMTISTDAGGCNIDYLTFVGPITSGLTINIAAPLNSVIYNAPATLPLTANVTTTTGTITNVQFFANGIALGQTTTAPYTFNWTGVAAGTYSITAVVTNSNGTTTTSVPVSVTVNPAIPSCPLLTWSDEFNGNSLDLTKWNYQTGNGCPDICGWGNNELEYYTNNADNVSVSGGALALTAQYQPNYNGSGNNYTSGKIVTLGNFSQKYGHFEARIKVPSAAGTWPAFWMLADSTAWPSTGEIDIEECANKNPVTWFGTTHYANAGGTHLSTGYTWTDAAPLSDDYHIYAADWTTDSISFYVDSVLRGTVSKAALIAGGGVWPFDSQKFYIIMNLAVGGNFSGQTPDSSQFPQSMLVDYVRVYSKDPCTVSSPVITGANTLSGTVGSAITNYTITASNGPTSFAITNLPTGLNFNTTTGVISGTPTIAGTFIDTIKAINSSGTGTQVLTITINAAVPLLPVISSASTASGTVLSTFTSYSITATNSPASYAVTGTLPPGLSFSGSTISGIPTVSGTFIDTVKATNGGGTGTQVLTINIAAASTGCSTSMVVNATSVPTIDGIVDAVWSNAPKNLIAQTISGTIQTGSTWQAMYDANNLYVLVQVVDVNLSNNGGTTNSYNQDGVELFIAGNNSKAGAYTANDHQYRFNWNILPYSTASITGDAPLVTTGITYAIPTSVGGYTLEAAIPWTTIGGSAPYNGKPIGFDININDEQTNAGVRNATVGWNGTATDDFDNTADFGTVNLTVCAATAPIITSATTASGTINTSFSYSITATNTPTGYSVGGTLPAGLTLNTSTGVISGTPTTVGTFIDTVKATNSGGTGIQVLTITVNPATPVVATTSTTGTVSIAFSYMISATNNPTSYNSTALPVGLSLNTTTGVISGTPATAGTFTVTDTAKNISGAGNGTLTITINPAKPVVAAASTTGTIGVAFSYAISGTNNPASYSSTILPAGLTLNTTTGIISGTPTTAGTFTVTDTAKNISGAGNGVLTIVINPAKPVVATTSTNGTVGTTFSYTIAATNTPTSYGSTILPGGLTLDPSTGIISGTPTTAGTFTVTDTAKNISGAGNGVLTIVINPAKPVVANASTNGTVGTTFSYTIAATNTPTSYGSTILPGGLTLDPSTGIISGTPTTAGTFTVTDTAKNISGAGNGVLTIVINPAKPVVTSTTVNGTTGTAFSYTIAATNNPTSYGVSALPTGLTFDAATGTINGTPTVAGTFTIADTATNISGNGTGTLTIVITTVLPPVPVVTSGSVTGTVGVTFNYSISATNSPTGFSSTSLPVGLSLNSSGVISGIPTTAGTYTITDTAKNAGGIGTGTLTITINPAKPIVATASTTGTVGTTFSYTIFGTNTPTSYGSTTLPAGLTLDPSTGIISGTPTTADTFTVTDTAKNISGAGNGTLTIVINPAKPVVATASTTGTVGTVFSYTISATNTPTSYGSTALPAGLTLNPSTGIISGTPIAAGTFTVTDTAKNISGAGNGTLTIIINSAKPVVANASTSGTVGTTFSYTISATNNPTSYGSTTLPAGLALDPSTGVISGTPTTAGTYTITDTAKNISGAGNGVLTIVINPAKPVVTSATVNGTTGTAFSYTIAATNNPTSYGVSALPTGLIFDAATGTISGTPTAAGTFTIADTAKNISGNGTGTLTIVIITVLPPVPVVTSGSVTGTVGVTFNYSISATNSPTDFSSTSLPAGLSLNSSGVISGIPTTAGTYTITDTAKNAGGIGTGTLTITINPAKPVVATASTSGTVGTTFSYTVSGTNTPTSYGSTTLPAGLALDLSTGVISGIPTTAGTFTVTDTAKNISGAGNGALTIVINPAKPVVTSATINGTTGTAFSYTIAATNNPTSYGVSALPTGLIFDAATGTISGTPTAAGTFTIADTAKNISGNGTGTLTIVIATVLPSPPVVTSGSIIGTVGVTFNYSISATNSPTGFSSTSLPVGLSLNSSGVISGIPTTAGTYTITDTAKNAGGIGTGTLTITINPAKPVVATASTTGIVGTTFSYTIAATNTPTSYGSTTLPAGLTLNPSTGIISGTPTTAGTFTVTDTAKNISGAGNGVLTILINPAKPVVATASTTGIVGTTFSYTIAATNTPTSYESTALPAGLTLNSSTGIISGTPTTAGTFTVTDTAKNISGAGNGTLTIIISSAQITPVITSAVTATGTVAAVFNYSITATNTPTIFGVAGVLPAGLSINAAGVISGTPTVSGTFVDTLKATNAAGTGKLILTITINSLPGVPLITSDGSVSGIVGESFEYDITATNSPTSYGATNLPAGLSINTATGEITGIPTSVGTSKIAITATNASGSKTNILTVMITAPPVPVISSADTATATEGEPFTYTIEASNLPTNYTATGLPQGLTIDPVTGIISGTPIVSGTFNVTLTVTNSFGTDTMVVAIKVVSIAVAENPKLMPNPVTDGHFKVTLPGWTTGESVNIAIRNFIGMLVQRGTAVITDDGSIGINVPSLIAGNYVIIIMDANKKAVKKFTVK